MQIDNPQSKVYLTITMDVRFQSVRVLPMFLMGYTVCKHSADRILWGYPYEDVKNATHLVDAGCEPLYCKP